MHNDCGFQECLDGEIIAINIRDQTWECQKNELSADSDISDLPIIDHEDVVNNPDLFEEKILRSPLTICFPEYAGQLQTHLNKLFDFQDIE